MEGNRKKFKMPHALVIMVIIIFIATVMTWIVPAGKYVRVENAQGVKVVAPNQFQWLERSAVGIQMIPYYIIQSLKSKSNLMYVTMFAGAAFHMIALSGALQVAVGAASRKFRNKVHLFIPVMTTLFAVICSTQAVNHFIAFAPIMVVIAMAFGLDSITGVAIILLGGAIGFSTAGLNINTAVLAQKICEVPLYSGLGFRAVCFVVFLVVTNLYLVRYVKTITKNPAASPMYELDLQREEKEADLSAFGRMDWRKTGVLISLVGSLVLLMYGNIKLGWDLEEEAALFLVLAVVIGFLLAMNPSKIASEIVNGCKSMLGAALLIGLAGAIAGVMSAGNITDTIVYGAGQLLSHMPRFLLGPAMFIANILVNMVIVSGSGQATAVMPIMAPLADLLGLTRQTAVLAFTFGDGFCNYVLPHSSALMGIIGAANVPYDRWMRFMWKLFLIWVVTGCALLSVAQMIHLGPM